MVIFGFAMGGTTISGLSAGNFSLISRALPICVS